MASDVVRARDHRERQIAEVLGRYGLSQLAHILGLERLASAADGLVRREPPESHTQPEKLRLALEELGPTFIKLGQLLSTRADLLSPDYRAELTKLQDAAPPVPSEVITDIVERELQGPADIAFATFETVPLAVRVGRTGPYRDAARRNRCGREGAQAECGRGHGARFRDPP